MTNTEIDALITFAERHGKYAFAHLCTAALNGEEWAIARVNPALEIWSKPSNWGPGDTTHLLFEAVDSTDTTRPDAAIARDAAEV